MAKEAEDINLTSREAQMLHDAFKTEGFCKLFQDYVDEVTDPTNQQTYEDEVTLMEKDRGFDVTFLRPEPGYVIKTSNNGKKVFINICKNKNARVASNTRGIGPDNTVGYNWDIPMLLSKPREDLDKQGKKCTVYDVMFNPNTLDMAQRNQTFKKTVEESALSNVEKSFNTVLDKNNIRYPHLKYKGMASRNVLRKKNESYDCNKDANDEFYQMVSKNMDPSEKYSSKIVENNRKQKKESSYNDSKGNSSPYKIKYRDYADLSDYLNETGPNKTEAIVDIDLPLVSSVSELEIEILDKSVSVRSVIPKHAYDMKINVAFSINEPESKACFDTDSKSLTLTLPLLKPKNNFSQETSANDSSFVNKEDEEEKLSSISQTNVPVPYSESVSPIADFNSHDISEFLIFSSAGLLKKCIKLVNIENISHIEGKLFISRPHCCTYDNCNFKNNCLASNLVSESEGSESYNALRFQFPVTHVSPSSIELFYCECKASLLVKFDTIDSWCVPMTHSFYLNFGERGKISQDKITVSVTDDRLSVEMEKDSDHFFPWKCYCFATNGEDLVEHKFTELVEPSTPIELEKCIILETGEKDLSGTYQKFGCAISLDTAPSNASNCNAEANITDRADSIIEKISIPSSMMKFSPQSELNVHFEKDLCKNNNNEQKCEPFHDNSAENSELEHISICSFSEYDELSNERNTLDIHSNVGMLSSRNKDTLEAVDETLPKCSEAVMSDHESAIQGEENADIEINNNLNIRALHMTDISENIAINADNKIPEKCENISEISAFENDNTKSLDCYVVLDNATEITSDGKGSCLSDVTVEIHEAIIESFESSPNEQNSHSESLIEALLIEEKECMDIVQNHPLCCIKSCTENDISSDKNMLDMQDVGENNTHSTEHHLFTPDKLSSAAICQHANEEIAQLVTAECSKNDGHSHLQENAYGFSKNTKSQDDSIFSAEQSKTNMQQKKEIEFVNAIMFELD